MSTRCRSKEKLIDAISLIGKGYTSFHCDAYLRDDEGSARNNTLKTNVALTYAQAGVSVDAGNALVEAIKPFVRATSRPGADAEIGGFGGVFDLKACGFDDPVLVSGTDGVGTKLRLAVDVGIHDLVGTYQGPLAFWRSLSHA